MEVTVIIKLDTQRSFQDTKAEALEAVEREYFTTLAEERGTVLGIAKRARMQRQHVRMYLRKHGLLGYTKTGERKLTANMAPR